MEQRDWAKEADERLRAIAEPVRLELREIEARLTTLSVEAGELHSARKRLKAVLDRIEPSQNGAKPKSKHGGSSQKRVEGQFRRKLDLARNVLDGLEEPFTASSLMRAMQAEGTGVAQDMARRLIEALLGEGQIRSDRKVRGGSMGYCVVRFKS